MNEGEGPETFFARQDRVKAKGINGNGMGAPLTLAATMWPTPATRDYKGANGSDHLENGTGRLHLDQLPNFVEHLWRTPQAMDAERGSNGTWVPKPKAGEHSLRHQIEKFPASFHQVHPIYPVGQVSSHPRRSLNPLFVEWLMGWPPGWTLLAWTDFACSGTELCRFKQRMRSALSQLASPAAAPPAQLGLFA